MRDQTIGQYLDELASAAPAPGGGAVAALHAAQAAALVAMVCNLTLGNERYAAAAGTMREVREAADGLRDRALALARDDAAAYAAVAGAYRLPRATEAERAARTDAIQVALRGATAVPLDTAELAAAVVELCGRILDSSSPSVLGDVGVAAASARAALAGAELNVGANLALMKDAAYAAAAADRLQAYLRATDAADAVFGVVRERVVR